jgi:putative ABC transport system substrate-binding protein
MPHPFYLLNVIKDKIPQAKKILIPFSSKESKEYAQRIFSYAKDFSLKIIPLELKKEDILFTLDKIWMDFDLILFIPDPIFSSETVARFLIQQAIIHQKGVIGYNRFFFNEGALLCFLVNFKRTGMETAYLIKEFMKNRYCASSSAFFEIILNKKVWNFLYKHRNK